MQPIRYTVRQPRTPLDLITGAELARAKFCTVPAKKPKCAMTPEGEDDEDFYLVLTARSDAHCDRVMELFGLPDNRFQDIRLLERLHALLVQLGASPETIRRAAAGAFDGA
jgi:hypothetical protein